MGQDLNITLKCLSKELTNLAAKYNANGKVFKKQNLVLAKLLYLLTNLGQNQLEAATLKHTALALECLRYALKCQLKKSSLDQIILISDCFYSEAISQVVLTKEPFIVQKLAEAISETAEKRLARVESILKPLIIAVFDLAFYFNKADKKASKTILKLKDLYLTGKLKLADLLTGFSLLGHDAASLGR